MQPSSLGMIAQVAFAGVNDLTDFFLGAVPGKSDITFPVTKLSAFPMCKCLAVRIG